MIPADAVAARIVAAIPDADVTMEDLTGTQDHWQATVVAPSFEGKSRLARHRLVYAALKTELAGPIHALALTLRTPAEAAAEAAA